MNMFALPTALALGASMVLAASVAAAPAAVLDNHAVARFEQQYLRFVIDHHYGALRMAELAAGTELHRSADITPAEGTAPTPAFRPTPSKALADEVKSIGRRDNRVQREEILAAQRMLMKWYRMRHTPALSAEAREMIDILERAPAGAEFDKAFLRHMSHHHYQVLGPSLQCVVGMQLQHKELQRYCKGIVAGQTLEIDEMRHLLCERYSDCHYQPFNPHGSHGSAPKEGGLSH